MLNLKSKFEIYVIKLMGKSNCIGLRLNLSFQIVPKAFWTPTEDIIAVKLLLPRV